jgi:cation diffusion facilitator CzcD-associated flavoprotein CzcO
MSLSPVAIIGAGPYGVSVAAHLKSAAIDFRIFGKPMYRWQRQMPKGMFLKSEGRASSLSDAAANYTLARYCAEQRLPYADTGKPISLDVFTQYALWFQRVFAPNVEELLVTNVESSPDGFEVHLSDGSSMHASNITVATGLEYANSIPAKLSRLPPELVSHSSQHCDFDRFKGRHVTIIGGGQSALESAALAAEAGASVRLLVRKPSLVWNRAPRVERRSAYQRLRRPASSLGEGLPLWFYSTAPMLFRRFPQRIRFEKVRTELGPAGAWWLKDRVIGKVQILLQAFVSGARIRRGRALLDVVGHDGTIPEMATDHVICATGYRFALDRLPFISQCLKSQVQNVDQQPVLSSAFESSVRGLYFTGVASASCFGPAMRFLHGAHYTARCVSQSIAKQTRRYVAPPRLIQVADASS